MHVYRVEFETPRETEKYRDVDVYVAVPNPPEAGGLINAISACPPPPEGLVLSNVHYSGPVANAADWQHVV